MFEIGSIVYALSGRDKGSYYLIVSRKENRIFIADGRRRTLQKPKVKNHIHLSDTGEKIALEEVTGNKKLKALLSGYNLGNNAKHSD